MDAFKDEALWMQTDEAVCFCQWPSLYRTRPPLFLRHDAALERGDDNATRLQVMLERICWLPCFNHIVQVPDMFGAARVWLYWFENLLGRYKSTGLQVVPCVRAGLGCLPYIRMSTDVWYVYTPMKIHMYVQGPICVCKHIYIYIYTLGLFFTYIRTHTYVLIYIHACMYMYVCLYIGI